MTQLRISGTVALRTRTHFGIPHLMAAARLSRSVKAIEAAHSGNAFGPFYDEVRGDASACVLLCVAAMEAYINEFFADRYDHFPETKRAFIDRVWDSYEGKPIVDKYSLALELLDKPACDLGTKVYQHAAALIKLRNGLVHFKPEWHDEQSEHKKLSERLAGMFTLSPWLSSEGAFPRAWATHGCTQWAVQTAAAFMDDFDVRAGRNRGLEKFLSRIDPS